VHKISIYAYIYENRKRKGEKKKEKGSRLAGPGGKISAQPSAGARRRGRMGPGGPRKEGTERAHAPERGGGNDVRGEGGSPATVRTDRW
jgi:hypothetical protein